MTNRLSEKDLYDLNQVSRLIAGNINDLIWIYNINIDRFTYASPSMELQLGYSVEEVLQKGFADLVAPGQLKESLTQIKLRIPGFLANPEQTEPYSAEIQLKQKSGGLIWFEHNLHFMLATNGEVELLGVSRNIDKRKLDELQLQLYSKELKFSEEKFFMVFNNSHVAMAISTRDSGIFVNANRQFYKLLGYQADEIIGRSSRDLNLFADWNQRTKAHELLASSGHLDNFEALARTKSGEILTCLFSVDAISIQNQNYILTSANDVTELKKAETKINYLYNQQKLLADISQLLNSSGNFGKVVNEVIAQIGNHTGVSRVYIFEDAPDGLSTSNTYEWCNQGIAPQIDALQEVPYGSIPGWKELLISEGMIFSENIKELPEEIRIILEPQEIKSILVFPLFLESHFFGFIGFDECRQTKKWQKDEIDLLNTVSHIFSNTFHRRNVINQLEISEMRLKLAVEGGREGIWDWNNETGHVYFSDTWCQMLGYEPHEIRQHVSSWEQLVHPEDMPQIEETLTRHLNGETDFYETIHRVMTKSGEWKWILDHGRVVQRNELNEPLRTIGTHIDFNRQKGIERELTESIKTKNKLFSIISHDLRGPVGSFLPILDLISTDSTVDESVRNELINRLKKSSRATYDLLENLLVWSNSQLNEFHSKPVRIDIVQLISENITLLSPVADNKSIGISLEADEPIHALADYDSVNLVMRNLLTNAIKFTPKYGSILITVRQNGNFVEISVADTGIGMKPELVDAVLTTTSFYTAAGTEHEKGSGLGLNLVKDFVHRNGGTIGVSSQVGKGSTFTFTLPAIA